MHLNRKKGQIRLERHLLHPRQNDNNKKRVVWIIILLLLSLEVPEIPTYVSLLYKNVLRKERDWFWLSSFHLNMVEYYYYKFSCDRIAAILRMIAFVKTAAQYSTVVFLATFIIMWHLVFDLFLFWINYNEWPEVYGFEILFLFITIRGLIHPYAPDRFARIKSIF